MADNEQKGLNAGQKNKIKDGLLYSTKKLLLLFIFPILLIIVGGFFFYRFQELDWRQNIQNELSAISQLKTDQIQLWYHERLADADFITENVYFSDGVSQWMKLPDPVTTENLFKILQEMGKDYPYQDIVLVDVEGNVLMGLHNIVKSLHNDVLSQLPAAFKEHKSVFIDFHYLQNNENPHLDVIAPLFIKQDNVEKSIGAVILSIDPAQYLYPLIESWPTSSHTGENLLVRRDGDYATYLNELIYQKDTALKLKIPLSQKNVPAVKAVLGTDGFFEGKDYRGVQVLSVLAKISDTPWFMVTKIDSQEALAGMQLNSFLILGMIAGLLIIILAIGGMMWQRRQRLVYQSLYRGEIERKALLSHFQYLVKYANDIIFLADANRNIVEANNRALEVYGYTREEFYKLKVDDLIALEDMTEHRKRQREILEKGSILREGIHKRKDGSTFHVEVSIKPIKVEGIVYEQAIIRDITDRKKGDAALRESEERYRKLVETSPDGIIIYAEEKYVYVNPAYVKLVGGKDASDFIGRNIYDVIYPENLETMKERCHEIYTTGKPSPLAETKFVRFDGSVIDVETTAVPFIYRGSQAIQAVVRDISARKRAEDALSHSEAFLKIVIESSPYAMCISDKEGTILQINQACRDSLNITDEETLGRYNILKDKNIKEQGYKPLVSNVFNKGETARFILKYMPAKEENQSTNPLFLDLTLSAVKNAQGAITNVIIQFSDITERIRIEEQLKSVNRLYALLSDINQTIVRTKDRDELFQAICRIAVESGHFRFAWIGITNKNTQTINPVAYYGYGKDYLRMFPGYRQYPSFKGPIDIALEEGRVNVCNDIESDESMIPWREEALKRGYRSLAAVPFKLRGEAIGNLSIYADRMEFFSKEEVSLLNEIGTDISFALNAIEIETERLNMEKALRSSEEKLKRILDTAPAGIGIIINHVIQDVNIHFCEMTGYSRGELLEASSDFFNKLDENSRLHRKEIQKQIDELGVATIEIPWQCKNGDIIDVLLKATPLNLGESLSGTIFAVIDITEKKHQLEEQQRMGKLESIGLLAGGIAHDFNNILTAILGNINLARMKTKGGDDIGELLESTEKASLRAQGLTQQLLTFAKGGTPVKKIASVSELVKEIATFSLIGSNIKCQFYIPNDLWQAEIDAGQISQVITNLIINAQHAMPEGGLIEIYGTNINLTEKQSLGRILPLEEGNYIRIAITDHGIGIPAEYLDKIFDPYFTTKQKGSGLGLAIAYSIVYNHGGYIGVDSTVGKGSTFYIYLPASKEEIRIKETERRELPAEKGRILVMDDEQVVREVAGRMLNYLGFNDVQFADDGREAIRLYREAIQAGKPFAIVILDLTIPGGMGGQETIKELSKINPEIKAIVSSGYANETIITEYKEYGFTGVVAKPYTLEQLRIALSELMEED